MDIPLLISICLLRQRLYGGTDNPAPCLYRPPDPWLTAILYNKKKFQILKDYHFFSNIICPEYDIMGYA